MFKYFCFGIVHGFEYCANLGELDRSQAARARMVVATVVLVVTSSGNRSKANL